MDSPIYIRVGQRKEVLLSPLKILSHLGRTWTRYHQRSKQKLPKDVTGFATGVGNCLKGSQTCGDTVAVTIPSGFVLMGFLIHRDNSDSLSLRWLKDFIALHGQQMNLTTH